METQWDSNPKGANMKKMKSDGGAMSTNAKPFGAKGSSKGIPASTMQGKVSNAKGKKATFSAGKKKVAK